MASEAEKLGKTGERMVPDLHRGTLIYAEHFLRYLAVQEIVKGKVVLDIASGSGYGTQILAKYAQKVYGIDVDDASIRYAKKKYNSANIEYRVGNGESIPIDDASIDVVVTFETIEHIKDYRKFLKEVRRVLKTDGIAIVSTPNDLEFAEGNHYHLHEFTYDELVGELKREFKNIKSYYQATWKAVGIGTEQDFSSEGSVDTSLMSFSIPHPNQYLYFYLLCSNRNISEQIEPVVALGEHYSDRAIIGKEMTNEKNLQDYREILDRTMKEKQNLEAIVLSQQDNIQELKRTLGILRYLKIYQIARGVIRAKRSILRNVHSKS